MGFDTADGSYKLSSSTLSNGSCYVVEHRANKDQDGMLVSASAYFRTESLLSEPLTSNKTEARDSDKLSNSEQEEEEEEDAMDKNDELLSEISVHDTFNGALRYVSIYMFPVLWKI